MANAKTILEVLADLLKGGAKAEPKAARAAPIERVAPRLSATEWKPGYAPIELGKGTPDEIATPASKQLYARQHGERATRILAEHAAKEKAARDALESLRRDTSYAFDAMGRKTPAEGMDHAYRWADRAAEEAEDRLANLDRVGPLSEAQEHIRQGEWATRVGDRLAQPDFNPSRNRYNALPWLAPVLGALGIKELAAPDEAQAAPNPKPLLKAIEEGMQVAKAAPAARAGEQVGEHGAWRWARPGDPKRSERFYDPRLSPQENKAIELGRNGYTQDEIADEMDTSAAALRVVLHNARRKGAEVAATESWKRNSAARTTVDQLVKLRDTLGKDYATIAERAGTTPNNVKVRLFQFDRVNRALENAKATGVPAERLADEVATQLGVSKSTVVNADNVLRALGKTPYLPAVAGVAGAGAASQALAPGDAEALSLNPAMVSKAANSPVGEFIERVFGNSKLTKIGKAADAPFVQTTGRPALVDAAMAGRTGKQIENDPALVTAALLSGAAPVGLGGALAIDAARPGMMQQDMENAYIDDAQKRTDALFKQIDPKYERKPGLTLMQQLEAFARTNPIGASNLLGWDEWTRAKEDEKQKASRTPQEVSDEQHAFEDLFIEGMGADRDAAVQESANQTAGVPLAIATLLQNLGLVKPDDVYGTLANATDVGLIADPVTKTMREQTGAPTLTAALTGDYTKPAGFTPRPANAYVNDAAHWMSGVRDNAQKALTTAGAVIADIPRQLAPKPSVADLASRPQ